jgi:hypothetical protein
LENLKARGGQRYRIVKSKKKLIENNYKLQKLTPLWSILKNN